MKSHITSQFPNPTTVFVPKPNRRSVDLAHQDRAYVARAFVEWMDLLREGQPVTKGGLTNQQYVRNWDETLLDIEM